MHNPNEPDRTPAYVPRASEIVDAFGDVIAELGGTVVNVYADAERVFARGVLPRVIAVRVGDPVHAGVTLRAGGADVLVHPYTFRQVCANGAIAAHVLGTRAVERLAWSGMTATAYDAGVILGEIRDAVRACAAPDAFAQVARGLRTAAEAQADVALHLLPALGRFPAATIARVLPLIMRNFDTGGDRTAFGLLNAVTAVARDEPDPALRWDLEDLGGLVAARITDEPTVSPGLSVRADARTT